VEKFNSLGSILNLDNKINTQIAERIAKGNKSYYANSKLIKSKLKEKHYNENI
jgi:ATP-dependent Lon protease